MRLPAGCADLLAKLHRGGRVLELSYEEDVACVLASVSKRTMEVFAPFLEPTPTPKPRTPKVKALAPVCTQV